MVTVQKVPSADLKILELNRHFAGKLGLDPNYTISSNIAFAISQRTAMDFTTAKFLFHGGVSGLVSLLAASLGGKGAAAILTGAVCWYWLESFDDSRYQR